jgi:hypothetical protein
MKNRINPIGLKGNEINERMKTLMGISTLNENKSNIVVELTKLGPDNKVYAIIREITNIILNQQIKYQIL